MARELARIDLPLSTMTQWYWKIDGHNLFHALGLRCDLHAQWETRQYFNWMAGAAKRLMPVSFEAWEDYHFYAKRFSRQEMELLRHVLTASIRGKHLMTRPDEAGFPNVIYKDQMSRAGLSERERDEFLAKFDEPDIIDFDLDLSLAKPGEVFEEKYRKAAER